MTLFLGSNVEKEAFWGTDTLVHYPDGRFEYKQKYRVFKKKSLVIFPRGSDILTTIWLDNFENYLGTQSLSDFFSKGYEQPLRALVPTHQEYLQMPNHHPCTEAEYLPTVDVELIHCFYDPKVGARCVMLANYYAGRQVGKKESTMQGYFSRPSEDERLKVSSFEQDYISNIMIPVAAAIKELDDKALQKAVIGGELEVIHFQGSNIIELGAQYRFPNT